MIQLTLVGSETRCTLGDVVSAVAQRWSALSGEGDHLTIAAGATRRRFAEWSSRPLGAREQARVAAYFGAVARRSMLRTREPSAIFARRRLVAASIRADLLDAGWSAERATAEVLRMMGEDRGTEGAA